MNRPDRTVTLFDNLLHIILHHAIPNFQSDLPNVANTRSIQINEISDLFWKNLTLFYLIS